jgi:hypothetical protein
MCVATVSEAMCRMQWERLTFVELVDDDDADLTYPLAFALRKGQSPNVWAVPFMEIAHEVMAKGVNGKACERPRAAPPPGRCLLRKQRCHHLCVAESLAPTVTPAP